MDGDEAGSARTAAAAMLLVVVVGQGSGACAEPDAMVGTGIYNLI